MVPYFTCWLAQDGRERHPVMLTHTNLMSLVNQGLESPSLLMSGSLLLACSEASQNRPTQQL